MTITTYRHEGDENTVFYRYHASETIEVYEYQTAQLVNHLLNHITLLTDISSERVLRSGQQLDVLWNYPRYKVDEDGSIDPDYLLSVVRDECNILMDYIIRCGQAKENYQDRAEREQELDRLLSAAQDRVPFLRYFYGPKDTDQTVVIR